MSHEARSQHGTAVERVIEAMKERLGRPFRLEQMAEVAIMSPFHLVRVFREVTGLPPRRFLTALRLGAAKRLLVGSDLSVTDVSLDVGYNSLGTFTRRFTEMVGTSPAQFRQLARAGAGDGSLWTRQHEQRAWSRPSRLRLEADLVASDGGSSPAFAGLFEAAAPYGAPAACAVLREPGRFWLPAVPDGTYHLLAVGLPLAGDYREALLNDRVQRGAVVDRLQVRNGRILGPVPEVRLREAAVFDPPILTALPLLLNRHLSVEPPRASRAGR